MSSVRKTAVAFLLIFSIGAQWPLLQSFAWLNMFVTFASEGGVKEALAQTFDGKHPCKICKFVQEGKEAEKKSPKQETEKKKLDPMIAQSSSIRVEPVSFPGPEHGDIECVLRVYTPLREPPDFSYAPPSCAL